MPLPAIPILAVLVVFARAPVPHVVALGVPALEAAAPPVVPWDQIARRPESYLGRRVRVFAQHHSFARDWNPYLTRFAPDAFVRLRAWSDEQRPWIRADFDGPAMLVHARRGTEAEAVLLAGARHERFMLTCVVRELFLGQAWVEVVHARRMRSHVPEGSVLHAIRADEHARVGSWQLACDELVRALGAPLPEHVARELDELRAEYGLRAAPRDAPASGELPDTVHVRPAATGSR